jgi:hypothetical protein
MFVTAQFPAKTTYYRKKNKKKRGSGRERGEAGGKRRKIEMSAERHAELTCRAEAAGGLGHRA